MESARAPRTHAATALGDDGTAMHVREELVKAAESLKGNLAVVKGIELYDAQVKMLHDGARFFDSAAVSTEWLTTTTPPRLVHAAQNSEMAQRIMDMLNKAKETIVATIETVAAMPITKVRLVLLARTRRGVAWLTCVMEPFEGHYGALGRLPGMPRSRRRAFHFASAMIANTSAVPS